ncbi:MAG: helix-turn-helix domain-containing protein, partial [Pseudomonadota bacterium]
HVASEFDLPLTRGEIANMLGLTIETVSRKLKELEASGAILRKGKRGIELVDPALLQALSGRGETAGSPLSLDP